MRRSALALLLAAPLLAGCFHIQTILILRPDGSGTIEETVALNPILGMMMGEMPFSAEDLSAPSARAQARFGPAVELIRAEPLDLVFGEGYRATYGFQDIEAVQVPEGVVGLLPEELLLALQQDYAMEDSLIAFERTGDRLTIHLPERRTAKVDTMLSPSDMGGMLGSVVRDVRLALMVQFEAPIAETDAAFVEGDRLTLYDLDAERMMGASKIPVDNALLGLDRPSPPSLGAALAALQAAPGVRLEPSQTVTVRFDR